MRAPCAPPPLFFALAAALSACAAPATQVEREDSSTSFVAVDQSIAAPATGTVTGTLAVSGGSGSALVFAVVTPPAVGTVTLVDAATGLFHYVTQAAPLGFESFTFNATQDGHTSSTGTVHVAISDGGVAGTLTFDFVPTQCDSAQEACALDYAHTVAKPMRNVNVVLRDASRPDDSNGILSQTISDAQGHYLFAKVAPTQLFVDAVAQMDVPPFRVQDNTQGGAVYVMRSPQVNTAAGLVVDLHAPSGGTSASATDRVAAPFNILDVALRVYTAFATARPELVFAPLALNWSVQNRPQCCDVSSGAITTSHWDGSNLYLLGAADIDEDEYDTHVTAHEWGHYFETTQARSDSPGGPHGPGDLLEPRIAFSEGWGNSESAMALYPETLYTDCSGTHQDAGFFLDLDHMDSIDTAPGWFSESSVGGILYDLFDPADPNKPWDHVSLGLGPIIDAMRGPHRTTPAVTSLFSFIAGLKLQNPSAAAAIDAVVAHRHIDAIVDAYGTQETHGAGIAAALPVFAQASIGHSVQVGFHTPSAGQGGVGDPQLLNKLGSNRLIRFLGDGSPVNITATAPAPVFLNVYSGGAPPVQAYAACGATSCTQSILGLATVAGQSYIINVASDDPRAEDITCSVAISH